LAAYFLLEEACKFLTQTEVEDVSFLQVPVITERLNHSVRKKSQYTFCPCSISRLIEKKKKKKTFLLA
jgi:hypothetical protein